MTPRPAPVLIVGSGAIAMIAALSLGRGQRVVLSLHRADPAGPSRIDSLPLETICALIELGVHPSMIGIDELHEVALTAWSTASATPARGKKMAHVDRRRLEQALYSKVLASQTIDVRIGEDPAGYARVIDATGRRAVTASKLVGPPTPWLARLLTFQGAFSKAQAALRIASLPNGYAYRIGTSEQISLGLVSPGEGAAPADELVDTLAHNGAGWLLAGLPRAAEAQRGRGGVCSVQWAEDEQSGTRIGDAALAVDALSSQATAVGTAQALALVNGSVLRQREHRTAHLHNLSAVLRSGRHAARPGWRQYGAFIDRHSGAAGTDQTAEAPVRTA